MGFATRLLLCLACTSAKAAAFDEFDQRVCEAQSTITAKVECYEELLPDSVCRYSDSERALGCFRSVSESRLGTGSVKGEPRKAQVSSSPSNTTSGVFITSLCYERVPVTCSFNEMTLAFCNKQGDKHGSQYSQSGRSHLPGGNSFRSIDGKYVCRVSRIKSTEPTRYHVVISR